jgi:2-dehydro-3-deoxyphosphooctonate aldolase (KDO 8-P synthase)
VSAVVSREIAISDLRVGGSSPLLLIAGPCVIEDPDQTLRVAEQLLKLTRQLSISFVFKSSYLKDNRTRGDSPRGPGLQEGLAVLQRVRAQLGCPVLTDVHQVDEVLAAAQAGLDVLQVPAFLSRQTRLLEAAAASGKAVNVKKGQFLAPEDLRHIADKLVAGGCRALLFTERGTSFGYHDLVVDFRGFAVAHELGWPWIFDVTHSLQRPSGAGGISGGTPQLAPLMARAAVAAGVDGLFLEAHPDPARAWSDAATQLPLDSLAGWLGGVVDLHRRACELRRHAAS